MKKNYWQNSASVPQVGKWYIFTTKSYRNFSLQVDQKHAQEESHTVGTDLHDRATTSYGQAVRTETNVNR